MDLSFYITKLTQVGVEFEKGLTDLEIERIQADYDFIFPPDLREFLQCALPVSDGFWNWRREEKAKLEKILLWPLEGICFDIECNDFWMDEWGEKPSQLKDQLEVAKSQIRKAPTLIPLRGHRFLPSKPSESGNPVFSVYQTDIIYYGRNLQQYLYCEFPKAFDSVVFDQNNNVKQIEFWSKLAMW